MLLVMRLEMDKSRLALKDAESKWKAVKAKEDIARAEVRAIDEQLDLYTLRSPIAGRLGMVHAFPGQTLASGASVAEVINLEEIDVLCFVPTNIVHKLQIDQTVRIEEEGEAITEAVKSEQGRIVFISEQAQAETGTIAMKARFANQNRKLRANTLLRVRVLTAKKTDCITIPEAALLEDQEEPNVLVVETEKKRNKEGEEEEEHHARKMQVKLGLRDRDKHRVEVLGLLEVEEEKKKPVPLEKDTLFIVEGGHGLEDKDLVKEKKEEARGRQERRSRRQEGRTQGRQERRRTQGQEGRRSQRRKKGSAQRRQERREIILTGPKRKRGFLMPLLALRAGCLLGSNRVQSCLVHAPLLRRYIVERASVDTRRHLQRHAHAQRRLSRSDVSAHQRHRAQTGLRCAQYAG